jgi:hypothetical protein
MKNNANITQHDPFILMLRSKSKIVELFGEDFLDDYGIALPLELIERYQENMKQFNAIQKELEKYYEEQENRY